MPYARTTSTSRSAASGRTDAGGRTASNGRASAAVPASIALVGDSITANGGRCTEINSLAYLGYANTALGANAYTLAQSVAVSGATTADMLNQIAPALSGSPAWVSVLGGVNDITSDTASATTIANLTTIYDAVLAAGARLIACVVLPCTSFSTSGRKSAVDAINTAIRAYAAAHSPVVLCDWWSVFADANSNGGYDPVAGYTSDGKHPNATGAEVMGTAFAAAVATVKPGISTA